MNTATKKTNKDDDDDVIYLDKVQTIKHTEPATKRPIGDQKQGMDSTLKAILAVTAAILIAVMLIFCCCFGSPFLSTLLMMPTSI